MWATTAQQNEQDDGAHDGDEKRAETAEAIREEREHLWNYARAASAGLVKCSDSPAATIG